MQNYNPSAIHVAPPKTWILRAVQDPDECWCLKRSANLLCQPNELISQLQKFNFYENLKFYHHGQKSERPITLHHNFSGNSPLQILNPHHHSSGWTKANWTLPTDVWAKTKKPNKSKNSCWPWFVQIAADCKGIFVDKVPTWGLGSLHKQY